jgi:hypothetical protein
MARLEHTVVLEELLVVEDLEGQQEHLVQTVRVALVEHMAVAHPEAHAQVLVEELAEQFVSSGPVVHVHSRQLVQVAHNGTFYPNS